MRIPIIIGVAIGIAYLAFCSVSLGYYVEPQEWFTGSYKNPIGHACLRRKATCDRYVHGRYFDDSYYGGDAYSYNDNNAHPK
jgi:hypothetical protein